MRNEKDSDEIFPHRLKAIRELRQYSQVKLGQEANMPASSIAHFEAGSRKPSFDTLRKLARALEVTTDYLLGTSDEGPGSAPSGNALFRDIERLSGEDIELTKKFVAMLKERTKTKKDGE